MWGEKWKAIVFDDGRHAHKGKNQWNKKQKDQMKKIGSQISHTVRFANHKY